MLSVLAAPGEQRELSAQAFGVLEHLERAPDLHARHNGERAELPLVAHPPMHEHRLREILADRPQGIVVSEVGLELLPLVRLQAEARNEAALPDLLELLHATRTEHLHEESVLRARISDTDRVRRHVRDINDRADALARHIVDAVEFEVNRDLHRLGERKEECKIENQKREIADGVHFLGSSTLRFTLSTPAHRTQARRSCPQAAQASPRASGRGTCGRDTPFSARCGRCTQAPAQDSGASDADAREGS